MDWKESFDRAKERMLNNPPYVVLKGVDKPPEKLASTVQELMYYQSRNVRLQHWLEFKLDDPCFRPVPAMQWPDQLEEYDELVDQLVRDHTVPHKGAAVEWLYKNNHEFKVDADLGFEEQKQHDEEWKKKWLFWKFNRTAWTVFWCNVITRKNAHPTKRTRTVK